MATMAASSGRGRTARVLQQVFMDVLREAQDAALTRGI